MKRDSEDCLLVHYAEQKTQNAEGQTVVVPAYNKRLPLNKVEDVVVMGNVTLTAPALFLLLEKNVQINFLNGIGQFKGRLSPALSKNSLLRLAQHRTHNDLDKRADLARRFVIGKLSNQRTMLLRYNRKLEDAKVAEEAQTLAKLVRKLATDAVLKQADEKTEPTTPLASGDQRISGSALETILGLEGAGSAAYFRCFGKLITDNDTWPFSGRVKRPATDPVNALLSYGYAILTNQVASAVQTVGFDHYVGYLHSSVYGRPALALDLMEEFRPIIVDSVVLTLLNNRMLKPSDFEEELGSYRLKKEPRKLFLTKFEERLNEEIKHPVFGYKVKYRRCIELQARLVAKYLTGELEEYPPFIAR